MKTQKKTTTLPNISCSFQNLCPYVIALNKNSLSLAVAIIGPCTALAIRVALLCKHLNSQCFRMTVANKTVKTASKS